MSWDQNGDVIYVDEQADDVFRIDISSGAITALTTGGQPWGGSLSCGAPDPITGDIFVATDSGTGTDTIYRLSFPTPNGAPSVTPVTTLPGGIRMLTFDPDNGTPAVGGAHHILAVTVHQDAAATRALFTSLIPREQCLSCRSGLSSKSAAPHPRSRTARPHRRP